MTPYYEIMRSSILKEGRLNTLVSVSVFVDSLYEELEEIHDDWKFAFEFVLDTIVKDIQQRLTFRSQVYISREIRDFKLRDEEVLVFARARGVKIPGADKVIDKKTIQLERQNSFDEGIGSVNGSNGSIGSPVIYGGGEWFPTVSKTLWLLRCLSPALPVCLSLYLKF